MRYSIQFVLVTAIYVLAAKIGFYAAFMHGSVSAVWPPSGIALAAILLSHYRLWPAVALGAFLANLLTPVPLWVAGGIAVGNTLEALVGAYVLLKFTDFNVGLQRVRIVLALVLGGAMGSTMIAASIGVFMLCLGGAASWENFADLWRVWWLGDAVGYLMIAPLIVTWGTRSEKIIDTAKTSEAALLCIMTATVALPIFFGWFDTSRARLVWGYAVFPFLIATAMRHGQRTTAISLFLVASIAILGTAMGYGPFAYANLKDSVLHLQVYIAVIGVTGLLLAATVAEHRDDKEQLRLQRNKLEHVAHHDPLTGLPNRSLLRDRLNQAIVYAERYNRMVTVVFVDLDRFKLVNDSHGHDAGDEVLGAVSNRLSLCIRKTDTASRLGGDEFLIVLFDQPSLEDSIDPVLERIKESVAQPVSVNGSDIQVTCSMGYATFPNDGADAETLIRNADSAMYRAKELGRNNIQNFGAQTQGAV